MLIYLVRSGRPNEKGNRKKNGNHNGTSVRGTLDIGRSILVGGILFQFFHIKLEGEGSAGCCGLCLSDKGRGNDGACAGNHSLVVVVVVVANSKGRSTAHGDQGDDEALKESKSRHGCCVCLETNLL